MTDNEQSLVSPLGADLLTSALVEVMGDADARDAQRLLNALAARGATVASTQPLTEQLAERDATIARLRGLLSQIAAPIGNGPMEGERGFSEMARAEYWRGLAIRYREIAALAEKEG